MIKPGTDTYQSAVIVADTETTSLHADTGRVWDFAGFRLEPDGLTSALRVIVEDVDLSDCDPMSLEIGRFHERHPRHGGTLDPGYELMPEVYAAKEIAEFTSAGEDQSAPHLFGQVPSFDEERLRRMLTRYGLAHGLHYHLIDAENVALGWLAHWRHIADVVPSLGASGPPRGILLPPYDSRQLAESFRLDVTRFAKHTGWGDVQATYAWLKAMLPNVFVAPVPG